MKHILRLLGTALLLAMLFAVMFVPQQAFAKTNKTQVATRAMAVDPNVVIPQLYQYVNAARAQGRVCGSTYYNAAPALTPNSNLALAAQWHTYDMVYMRFFSHTGSDGSQPWDRVTRNGYNWRYVGENIAAGNAGAQATVNQWLNSPGHCANIMNPNFVDMGAGFVEGGTYGYYWTLVFAAPAL